jgi:hypothetical protein
MAIRKIARIVNAAYKDADLARRTSHSPEFRKAVTKDRRGALSEYRTVKHALRDRERLAAAKGGEKAKRKK